jgi:hypothetical protein
MKLLLISLWLVFSASPLFGQYEIIKSDEGYLVVSKVPGRKFTLDVPGKHLTPYGSEHESHPYLNIDGVFLQVLSVSLEEIKADPKWSDEAILKKQMKYEADYYKVPLSEVDSKPLKLPGGGTALLWSFAPKLTPNPKTQIFLTLHSGGYDVIIGSAIEGSTTRSVIEPLLIKTAASFHRDP